MQFILSGHWFRKFSAQTSHLETETKTLCKKNANHKLDVKHRIPVNAGIDPSNHVTPPFATSTLYNFGEFCESNFLKGSHCHDHQLGPGTMLTFH